MWHEEIESLVRHIRGIKRMRFWMTFTKQYLDHFRVLQNVGLTRTDHVEFNGRQIVPLKFLKTLLPNPGELGERTRGKTCIGCLIKGRRNNQPRSVFIYNVCDHEACYREVGSQAVAYTTGVPAAIGAALLLQKDWAPPGVFNLEQLDPDPFMAYQEVFLILLNQSLILLKTGAKQAGL